MSRSIVNGKVLNHVPDSWSTVKRSRSARALLRAAGAPPPQPGLAKPHVLSILDQGQLGSCTGNGTAQAIRAAQHLAGVASPSLVSRLWLYWLGRSFDHDTGDDAGAQIGNVFLGGEMYGLGPEDLWPYSDDSSANGPFKGPPPAEMYRAAFDAIATFRAHRLDSTGDALLDDVRAALGQGRLVVFGSAVSNEYCQNAFDPSAPLDPPAPTDVAGLHCECFDDFDPNGNWFEVVNSWGPGWGNGGRSLFKPSYLLDSNSSDFYVVDAAPPSSLVDPA